MDNREIRTSYGTVRHINNKKKKMKLITKGILGISGAVIILLSGLNIYRGIQNKKINDIPENQVMTTISISVESGDSLTEIANRFYTDDCEGVYRYISNYQDAIQEKNKIMGNDPKLIEGRSLKIPVIVDENNVYYQRVSELENKINEIEQSNKWVYYTVESGDNLSSVAEFASGSFSETYEIMNEIAEKNNISVKAMLREGQRLWIVNPELGNLKRELNETQELFIDYLSGNHKKNNY